MISVWGPIFFNRCETGGWFHGASFPLQQSFIHCQVNWFLSWRGTWPFLVYLFYSMWMIGSVWWLPWSWRNGSFSLRWNRSSICGTNFVLYLRQLTANLLSIPVASFQKNLYYSCSLKTAHALQEEICYDNNKHPLSGIDCSSGEFLP